MFNKKLYITIITIISILILSISCGNSMTDSTNGGNGENNGGSISGVGETNSGGSISGGGTNSGGSGEDINTTKTYIFLTPDSILSLPENDPKRIEFHRTNWLNTFTNQIRLKSIGGVRQDFTDENANYYDDTDKQNIRSKFIYGTNYIFNGKNYSVGFHKDLKNTFGFVSSWKIILIDEQGNEYLFNGNSAHNNEEVPKSDTFKSPYNVGIIVAININ